MLHNRPGQSESVHLISFDAALPISTKQFCYICTRWHTGKLKSTPGSSFATFPERQRSGSVQH